MTVITAAECFDARLCTCQCLKNWTLFTLSCRDYSNSLLTVISSPDASLSVLYLPNFVKSVSKSHALWWRWPWDLSSTVIWPNKASFQPFQLYYVWNNCLLSPPCGVAVETDEHLTAVGWGYHDNTTNPHPCACGGCFFPLLLAVWVVHDMLSSTRNYGSREMERSWLQGLPYPSLDKGFSPTRKSIKPVKDQTVRSVKTSPEAALLPLLLLLILSYALTGLVFIIGPDGAIRVYTLFIADFP